jgi:hypothetical protein
LDSAGEDLFQRSGIGGCVGALPCPYLGD